MGGQNRHITSVPWFDGKDLFLRPDLTPAGHRAQRRSRIYRFSGARSASLTAASTVARWCQVGALKMRNESNGCYFFGENTGVGRAV